MTMTPEDKAKRVAGEIESLCCDYVGVFFFKEELAARLIALAIREAEDAAFDRAAVVVQTKVLMEATTFAQAGEMLRDRNGDEHFLGAKSVNELIERKASDIRSLKHNKD